MAKDQSRKAIAFLLPSMSGGGAERVALTVIQQFIDEGHEVDLVLLQRKGELLDALPPSIRVIDLAAPRIRDAFIPFYHYLRQNRPVALQASMWPLTIIAILVRFIARVPCRVIISEHAILSQQYPGSRLVRATTRLFYRFADARIVVSQGLARDIAALTNMSQDDFVVIHNPISFPENFDTLEPRLDAWGDADIRILNVGALKSEKDQELLVEAFAHFAERHPNAALVVIGEGELREQISSLARDKNVDDRVNLTGYMDDPWPYYAAATMFVLSSRQEGLGNVLIEALYAGLPIVSQDCPAGPREILQDGKFGTLVLERDPTALAAAMTRAMKKVLDKDFLRDRAIALSGSNSMDLYRSIIFGD